MECRRTEWRRRTDLFRFLDDGRSNMVGEVGCVRSRGWRGARFPSYRSRSLGRRANRVDGHARIRAGTAEPPAVEHVLPRLDERWRKLGWRVATLGTNRRLRLHSSRWI